MKNKRIVGIVSIFLIVIALYLGTKGYFLHQYWIQDIASKPKIESTFTLEKKTLKEEDCVDFYGVKMDKMLQDFTLEDKNGIETGYATYVLYDNDKNIKEFFSLTVSDSLLTSFTGNEKIKRSEILEFLKANNIDTISSLLKFLKNYSYHPNYLWMSIRKMKENYLVQTILSNLSPKQEASLLEEPFDGFTYETKDGNFRIFQITSGKKTYNISFRKSEFFTDEVMKKLIETAAFDA